MDNVSFKIEGTEDLTKALSKVNVKMARKVVWDSLKLGASWMGRDAKVRAPKRTGRLRKAIKVKRSKINTKKYKGQYSNYLAIYPGKKRDDPKGAYYGAIVDGGYNVRGKRVSNTSQIRQEFGKRSGRKTAKGKRDIDGQQFMRAAYRNNARRSTNLIVKGMNIGIETLKKSNGFS